ncbi:uncharacterized protein LOC113452651 [Pseudonaja textilis]|uniref:uncharacterized protein LOC113452651 n=1 Tax=Pseudonaja textilis TaxID=8673 RepID=UPI000EA926ED|nr:uncharacterized protein LOC113452651 [Pseudonaja textilis]
MEERMEKMEENIQLMITTDRERMQKMEERGDKTYKKVGEIDNRLTMVEYKKGKDSILWEMDKADFYLRFQNIEEEKGENLAEIITQILAGALEISKEKMMDGMDEIYRVYTSYTMRNKLPREVHVRFTKKTMRTEILQKARGDPLKYKGKEIKALKQIPRKVRDLRREYQFLTKILIKKEVNYRWLILEGLTFVWQEQGHRIDSVERAELFYNEYFRGSEDERARQEELKIRAEMTKEIDYVRR